MQAEYDRKDTMTRSRMMKKLVLLSLALLLFLSLLPLRAGAEELRYGFESGAQEPNRVEIRIRRA